MLKRILIVVAIILYFVVRAAVQPGVIALLRRGALPPLIMVIVLIALDIAASVLGEFEGFIRGFASATEYHRESVEYQYYVARLRMVFWVHWTVRVAHILVFLFLLGQSLLILVKGPSAL